MAQMPMYQGMVNSPQTELATAIDDTQITIDVQSGDSLPDAPNLAVIIGGELSETILYTEKTGNTLSGITRGFQGEARGWSQGTKIARNGTEYDHQAFRDNIEDLQEQITDITPQSIGAETPQGAQEKADTAGQVVQSNLTTHTTETIEDGVHGLDDTIAKFKSGSETFTDNDTSQTFTDAFCTSSSLVTIAITSATKPQGVWTVESNNGSFTITSTKDETEDIIFDYYIQKAVV